LGIDPRTKGRITMEAEGKKFTVKHVLQTEVEDIFEVYDKVNKVTVYEKYPRTMYQTAENILAYLE
jgi:hypothetical protein